MSLECTEELCLMALKIDTKFEGKLTCASQNDMRNFANFHQSTFESLKNWVFSWVLLSNVENVWVWNLRGVMCHDNEEWCKIWRGIDYCQFKIDMRNFMNFESSTAKSQKFEL